MHKTAAGALRFRHPGDSNRSLAVQAGMNAPVPISEDVRVLLRDCIESYEQLRLLLALAERPSQTVSAHDLAHQLNIAGDEAATALKGLLKSRLIATQEHPQKGTLVSYAPASADLAAAVERLDALYRENPIEVIKLMSANSIERVRAAALHTFADAFVLGRKGDG